MTRLSIGQEGRDDDDPSLPKAHAQKTFFQALDEVTLPQVGVIGGIPRVTKTKFQKVCLGVTDCEAFLTATNLR